MKKSLFIILFLLVVSTPAFADQDVVTSETLSISDVINYIETEIWGSGKGRMLGIYQKDNSATVYLISFYKGGKKDFTELHLVRFNSGKWWHIDKGFVTK